MIRIMDPSASSSSLGHEPPPDYATQADVVIDADVATVSQPPNYSIAAGRPLRPIIYTFTDWDDNTVLLVPPGQAGELNPLYRISTSLNVHPFVPLSTRTTIQRGGTPQGPFVGLFEIGTPSRKYTKVRINNRTAKLTTFLTPMAGTGSDRHWSWTFETSIKLRWDCRKTLDDGSVLCICYHGVRHDQLAILVPPPIESFTYPPTEPTLTVFPDGHGEYFDHILLSGLAVHKMLPL